MAPIGHCEGHCACAFTLEGVAVFTNVISLRASTWHLSSSCALSFVSLVLFCSVMNLHHRAQHAALAYYSYDLLYACTVLLVAGLALHLNSEALP